MEENARLFALLNIAMADAAICSWDAKYTYHFWRPVTAIAFAEPQLNWMSFIVTPPFPDYTSGHSTFSAAAATVLPLFFGTEDLPFTTGSDFLPGVFRSFSTCRMQRRKRHRVEYTGAFTFDRQARTDCKLGAVSANGPIPITCCPREIVHGDPEMRRWRYSRRRRFRLRFLESNLPGIASKQ